MKERDGQCYQPPSWPVTSSRDIAYQVLVEHNQTGSRAADLLERATSGVSRDVARLASELVYSTIRRRETLDAIITPHVRRPPAQVERNLWELLRIGACQLALLETPAHASVHETVETARRCGNPRWTGFLNGTLRSVSRTIDKTQPLESAMGPRTLPIGRNRFRTLSLDVFADPQANLAAYLATAYSYPQWLVDRWLARRSADDAIAVCDWFNTPPRLVLRANRLCSTREEVCDALQRHNIGSSAGIHPDSVILAKRATVAGLPGYLEGRFSVQDEAAMAASTLLAPEPGQRVLDLCAGSGSKSCHLAEVMQNDGEVVAVDVSKPRLEMLAENTERLGITIVDSIAGDGLAMEFETDFDAALVDVPCSNTGVLGKRPEVRWRLQPEELAELATLQMQLLVKAAAAVKPGGVVLYSTCSIESEENERLVAAFLGKNPNYTLDVEQHHVPGQPADGSYQARLIKQS